MFSDIVPIRSEVIFVLAERDIPVMARNVEISTSAKTQSYLLFALKMPNAAIYLPILYVNVTKGLRAMEQRNVEVGNYDKNKCKDNISKNF